MTYLQLVDEEPHLVDEVWDVLDPAHCEQCYQWAIGQLVWWTDPETIEGQGQIKDIIRHYTGRSEDAATTG